MVFLTLFSMIITALVIHLISMCIFFNQPPNVEALSATLVVAKMLARAAFRKEYMGI